MKKEVFKSYVFFLLIIITLVIFSALVSASLVCEVKDKTIEDCSLTKTALFRLSDNQNAHAELTSGAGGYTWNVCCELQDVADTLDTTCTSPDAYVTALSSETNAHVEIYGETDYGNSVCLSANTGTIFCWARNQPCDVEETCVFSQNSETNAHAADCIIDPYSWRTCCTYFSQVGIACEDDCTYTANHPDGGNIIHKECDGINGCEFCPTAPEAPDICDLAQPGWIRDYNEPIGCPSEDCIIECAEGCPQPKQELKATVSCEEENLIKLTKLITYKGKLTKLVVAVCG